MSIQWSLAGVIWTWLFGGTCTPMDDQKDVRSTEPASQLLFVMDPFTLVGLKTMGPIQ